ncbi:MAG: hypothetical protein ACUVQ2_05025 [Dissulfurimicrobium sp.]|uniref:hypothetical protein n=1 Tax=Dissulfurimicrobium sp. TaxID=2022436 RepID=UPI004049872F
MNRLHSIIYPVTYTGFNIMRRLSGIFQRLTILIPAEDCTSSNQVFGSEEIILSPVAPCPFGERLSWFNGFIESITRWARDVGLGKGLDSQLARDFLKDDESIPAIIDALGKEGRKDPLLEAQIFLRLAHDLDQQEDETELALVMLKTKEASLKDILHGVSSASDEPERPFHEPNETTWTVSMPLKRLASWSELWARADADSHEALPIGISIDVKDLMDKAYESLANESAIDLLALKLPRDPSTCAKVWPDIEDGFEELAKAVSMLRKEAGKVPGKEAEEAICRLKEMASRLSAQWDSLTSGITYGPSLGLSLYPKTSFGELLFKASNIRLSASENSAHVAHIDRAGYSFYLY